MPHASARIRIGISGWRIHRGVGCSLEAPMANLFASGAFNLKEKLGPFLWQRFLTAISKKLKLPERQAVVKYGE